MAGERRALLIATDLYADPGLTGLRAPAGDVQALADVLSDPSIGGFGVQQLVNRATDDVKLEVEGFFDDARLDDLLLLYISGHGVLSPTRRLYFATASTKLKRLRTTAIEDGFLNDVMLHSRARSIVLVLDCCHSGAFAKGLTPKSTLGVDIEQRFEGSGRITLTASTELEYAFETADAQVSVSELGVPLPRSLFTRFLVEGLASGEADVNDDGIVSIDELYDYVYAHVRAISPHQTPGKSGAGHGDIVIAKSLRRGALPPGVREAIDLALGHQWPAIRVAAVDELARVRDGADVALAAAIDEALRRALDDDNPHVRMAAQAALTHWGRTVREKATPRPPEWGLTGAAERFQPAAVQLSGRLRPAADERAGESSLRIARTLLEAIFDHAARDAPNMCCGVVVGREGRATSVRELENRAASPYRFDVDGHEMMSVIMDLNDDEKLLAIYSSRNRSALYPSQTDVGFATAWPGVLWLLVHCDGTASEAHAYLVEDEGIRDVAIEVT